MRHVLLPRFRRETRGERKGSAIDHREGSRRTGPPIIESRSQAYEDAGQEKGHASGSRLHPLAESSLVNGASGQLDAGSREGMGGVRRKRERRHT